MDQDDYGKIQCFGGPLAAKYTWDNPFQKTAKADALRLALTINFSLIVWLVFLTKKVRLQF